MSSDARKSNNSHAESLPSFAKRGVKKAPSPRQDELKERRRKLFLKQVRDGREERRFEARGEDIMRLDFMQRQKQWEAEQALSAPSDYPNEDEEEDEELYDLPTSSANAMQTSAPSTQHPKPEDEVDEVLQREKEELEALLDYMPDDDEDDEGERLSRGMWSDDGDDYDALFSEFMEQDDEMASKLQQQEQVPAPVQDYDAMDMS